MGTRGKRAWKKAALPSTARGHCPRIWRVELGCGHTGERDVGSRGYPPQPGSPAHCFAEGCGKDTVVLSREAVA